MIRQHIASCTGIRQISPRVRMYDNLIIVILFQFVIFATGKYIPPDFQLYEGSECTQEDGGRGYCTKLSECPSRVAEVRQGIRNVHSCGRCGFDGSTEIVCCPVSGNPKMMRRADFVCNELSGNIDDGREFVYGGLPADRAEFPYAAALGYENDDCDNDGQPIKYSCGGTLISWQHVLTAAHCVNNIHEKVPVQVLLGTTDLNRNDWETQVIPISEIITHPLYRRGTLYNDIAILKLRTAAIFSLTVEPTCLQTQPLESLGPEITPHAGLIVMGWGSTSLDNDGSPVLMKSYNMSLVDRQECAKHYTGFLKLPRSLDENMICAIDANSSRRSDACQGDSGGPLIYRTFNGLLIGIASFGQSCGGPIPGVYTSIYPYLGWIEEQVWKTCPEVNPELINHRRIGFLYETSGLIMESSAKRDV